ncbi:MAG: AraC family transcriptional regulator [Lachnospiraceae bacterium]|nr:AraC family transcriptional regulator [Lachnospiraceae bacterium]
MTYTYLQERISKDLYANVRFYDNEKNLIKQVRPDERITDDGLVALIMKDPLVDSSEDMPLIFTVNRSIIYGFARVPEGWFLIGPSVFTTQLPVIRDIPVDPGIVNDMIPYIALSNVEILAENLLTLCNINRTGEADEPFFTHNDFFDTNVISDRDEAETYKTFYNMVFNNVEDGFFHNPYNHEHRERTCIQNGDVEGLKEVLTERFPGRYGTLSRDPLKQEIYIAIVAVTIACRAAIDGGLHPETAFSLSDITINKLDACRDTVSPIRISQDAEIQYATLVQELNEKKTKDAPVENRHISHCKDYIFAHLHGKITVQEIADTIGLEANYLSALFKRLEGTNLKQYIRHQQIKLVKNLLTYSTYSYSEIAAYLGYASQSHMCQEFKKETNMTPRAYREKYAREDFLNESQNSSC